MMDKKQTRVFVDNIKARDFEPLQPFQIIGRPSIGQGKGFQMHVEPGKCDPLHVLLPKRGRPPSTEREERTNLLAEWHRQGMPQAEMLEHLKATGKKMSPGTLRRELSRIKKALAHDAQKCQGGTSNGGEKPSAK